MNIVDLPMKYSVVMVQLIIDILISLDWFKGKSTGNHVF